MSALSEAANAAAIFAVDPAGLGGVCVRSPPQSCRDQWLRMLRELLPAHQPLRRVPFNINDERLIGGLDLVATLHANRAIAACGVLAETDGGVVIVSMAERLSLHTAACLSAALDDREITLSRDGLSLRFNTNLGIVALDEGISDAEGLPRSLLDRLALLLDFAPLHSRSVFLASHSRAQVIEARELLPCVEISAELIESICATGLALGAGSARISVLACRVTRIAAALQGRAQATEEDASLAGRLVLAPRASRLPASDPPGTDAPATAAPNTQPARADSVPPESHDGSSKELEDQVLAATKAAIPPGLLAFLAGNLGQTKTKAPSVGRVGALRAAAGRGRPVGSRPGLPRGAERLNVTATLRSAALWQRLRGRGAGDSRVRIETADFRVTRCKQRARTLTIFAVDASGSAALNRLAEAKGAVELLLAECYIRRDMVAVIAFRGRCAELLLPPTRSLVRAKRELAALPGGGGTPLAAAIESAAALAYQSQRRGDSTTIVVLSDGRANVARNGEPGRDAAHRDALRAANALRGLNTAVLFLDTSLRPNTLAKELAAGMNARYLPLPFVNAEALSNIVINAARDH